METLFPRLAQWTGVQLGKPYSFALACLLVLVWAATGSMFDYSDTWQLVINTGTTIVTFLMVFLLQSTQNRESQIIQLKLDQLIQAHADARDAMRGLQERTDEQMRRIQARFESLVQPVAVPEEVPGAQEETDRGVREERDPRDGAG